MIVPRSLKDVVAQISGWRDAVFTVLAGGLSNDAWKLTVGERSAVLKVDDRPRELPFGSRTDEAIVQNMAADAGIAPKAIAAQAGFILTEFVDGMVWSRDNLCDPRNLTLLGSTLRHLHSLPLTTRTFDPGVAATRYIDAIIASDASVISVCKRIIEEWRMPDRLCCCHNDLVVENILTPHFRGRSRLLILDWEYACDNDPLFDLATVIEHHELDSAQAACLLGAYLDGDANARIARLEPQRCLYLALLYLWMAARSDCNPLALARVGQRILTRNS